VIRKKVKQNKDKVMNSVFKAKKQILENTLSKVAKVSVEITFARTNMITIAWDEENKSAFERLQNYFKGKLFGYEYDEECDMSVCCLNL
jgi:hypothetical protein